MTILSVDMEQYRHTAKMKWLDEQQQRKDKRERAWQLVHEAARLLKEEYHVQRVVVFGSLIHPGRFTLYSDVDLAAWGLTSKTWLRAMHAVSELSHDIELNLVDVGCCRPAMLDSIEREGVLV